MEDKDSDFKSKLRVLKANQEIKLSNANNKLNNQILELVKQESDFLFEQFKENREKITEDELNKLLNNKEIRLKEIDSLIRKIAVNKCNFFIWELTFIDGII